AVVASGTGCAPVAPIAVHEMPEAPPGEALPVRGTLGKAPTKWRLGEGVPPPLRLARMPPPSSTLPAGQITVAVAKETGASGPGATAWTTAGPLPGSRGSRLGGELAGRLEPACGAGLGGPASPPGLAGVRSEAEPGGRRR